jgi:hypothetical protein
LWIQSCAIRRFARSRTIGSDITSTGTFTTCHRIVNFAGLLVILVVLLPITVTSLAGLCGVACWRHIVRVFF